MFTIGPYSFDGQVVLAPMAGVTDLPFRDICRAMGAAMSTGEMVTSDTSLWHTEKSRTRLMFGTRKDGPNSIQIAGADPEMMAQAAVAAEAAGADLIDINMGCPAKKVCKRLAGSALLQDEALVAQILNMVASRVEVPVTLKTRTGWSPDNRNGPTVARIAEDAGIAALTIHGRTRACRFNGNAEYDTIAEIVETVSIPVIANGDISSAEKAAEVLDHTGADAVMVGRPALGDPWIFQRIQHYLDYAERAPSPAREAVIATLHNHLTELYAFYGDYKGIRIARKHFAWYCQKHIADHTPIIKAFNQLETTQSQLAAVERLADNQPYYYEENVA